MIIPSLKGYVYFWKCVPVGGSRARFRLWRDSPVLLLSSFLLPGWCHVRSLPHSLAAMDLYPSLLWQDELSLNLPVKVKASLSCLRGFLTAMQMTAKPRLTHWAPAVLIPLPFVQYRDDYTIRNNMAISILKGIYDSSFWNYNHIFNKPEFSSHWADLG